MQTTLNTSDFVYSMALKFFVSVQFTISQRNCTSVLYNNGFRQTLGLYISRVKMLDILKLYIS